MKSLVIRYGLLAGLVISLFMLLSGFLYGPEDEIDLVWSQVFGYAGMILSLSTIFIALRQLKRNNNGQLKFVQGFTLGILITLVASVFYVTTWMLYSNTDKGQYLMEQYYDQTRIQIESANLSDAEHEARIQKMERSIEMYKNPLYKAGITFLEIFPVGLLISLICALLLRNKSST